MKKNRKNKEKLKGPKEDLLPGQTQNINEMFYRDFSLDYFENKIINLLEIIDNSKEYISRVENRYFKVGKFEFDGVSNIDENNVIKYAKSELISTYYHCLETFMRLFIAHAKFTECPLMDLTALSIEEYHCIINELSKGNIKVLNNKLTIDKVILRTAIGIENTENSPLSEKELKNLKDWIIWCAQELKNIPEYNSLKHGLSMLIGYGEIGIPNSDPPFYKKGDAVHILQSKKDDGRFKFSLNNIFTEYDFKVILVHFFSQLIENIMKIGKIRFVSHSSEELFKPYLCVFSYHELRDKFHEKGNIGDLMSSYALPLYYIDDLQMSELAKYIGLEDSPKSWKIAFEKIKNNIPKTIKWLDKKYADEVLNYYKLDDISFRKKYLETIDMINSNIYLKVLCYLWHYILYIDDSGLYKDVWNWNETKGLFKEAGNHMMPVAALLSGYEIHLKNMENRKFDQEQIDEQIKNVNQCCTMDRQRFGIEGIRFSQMICGSYFMNGRLIQVGRLQYEFDEEVPKSVKEFKDGSYMYIHIPKEEHLNIDDVNNSIKSAKEKIEKFYPEIEISKLQFYTNTWLLSNELDNILDANSNIIKFKNKFDIIAQTENTEDFLNFVFQEKVYNVNYENLKEETILQSKLKEYLLENKKLHIGLGILKEEL